MKNYKQIKKLQEVIVNKVFIKEMKKYFQKIN